MPDGILRERQTLVRRGLLDNTVDPVFKGDVGLIASREQLHIDEQCSYVLHGSRTPSTVETFMGDRDGSVRESAEDGLDLG